MRETACATPCAWVSSQLDAARPARCARGSTCQCQPRAVQVELLVIVGDHSSPFRQHFLYFLPLPQGQGSLRPTLEAAVRMVSTGAGL